VKTGFERMPQRLVIFDDEYSHGDERGRRIMRDT
jgi:hypothetical protein